MHDLVLPFRWHLARHRRSLEAKHGGDFSAEHALIELEGRFAVAFEQQIGIQLHRVLLAMGRSGKIARVSVLDIQPTSTARTVPPSCVKTASPGRDRCCVSALPATA